MQPLSATLHNMIKFCFKTVFFTPNYNDRRMKLTNYSSTVSDDGLITLPELMVAIISMTQYSLVKITE